MGGQRTKFGSELRKLRLMKDEILGETAKSIGVSTAMLSAIETGRKAAPDGIIERLAGHFGLQTIDANRLLDLARASRDQVRLDIEKANSSQRETAAVFARRFPELSEIDLERIRRVLEPEEQND